MHMHDFFGNTSVVATSTYESLRAGTSNCSARGDRAAYWAPTLMTPRGDRVRPERAVVYYRNRPVADGRTVAFPPGLRMVAGGTFPYSYWTCDGQSDAALESRQPTIPDCGEGGKIKAHVFFPSCWDGKHRDSPDHRSHVAYGLGEDGRPTSSDPERCPRSHPFKIPQLDVRIVYDVVRRPRLPALGRARAPARRLHQRLGAARPAHLGRSMPRVRREVLRARRPSLSARCSLTPPADGRSRRRAARSRRPSATTARRRPRRRPSVPIRARVRLGGCR